MKQITLFSAIITLFTACGPQGSQTYEYRDDVNDLKSAFYQGCVSGLSQDKKATPAQFASCEKLAKDFKVQ